MGSTYIASLAAVKVTHVRDIDLERALDLLVLGQDGLDRIVVVIHLQEMYWVLTLSKRVCAGRDGSEAVVAEEVREADATRRAYGTRPRAGSHAPCALCSLTLAVRRRPLHSASPPVSPSIVLCLARLLHLLPSR